MHICEGIDDSLCEDDYCQGIYPYEGLCFWGVSICGGMSTWEGANASEGMYTSESCDLRECTSVKA